MVICCNIRSATTNRITKNPHPAVINIRKHRPPVSFSLQFFICHNFKVELSEYKISNVSKLRVI
ncbi:hypothetical protein BT93_J0330 [Corymbia citriodora subsp. variegata]|nr:hypothetical protein BT93_J0330 [Corymbia citriodora subsp. variegata]